MCEIENQLRNYETKIFQLKNVKDVQNAVSKFNLPKEAQNWLVEKWQVTKRFDKVCSKFSEFSEQG